MAKIFFALSGQRDLAESGRCAAHSPPCLLPAACCLTVALLFSSFNAAPKTGAGFSVSRLATPEGRSRPGLRRGHCLVYDELRRRVLLLSGHSPPNQPQLDELWGWDGRRWELIPGAGPAARSLSGAVYDSRRKRVILFGGVGDRGYEDLRGDTWEWDGKSWQQM